MATVNIGSLKFNWKGAYNGSTAYAIDDVTEYNGSSYICILASTGNLPTNTTYFQPMATAGTDLSTTLTTQGDIVYRDGSGLQRLAKGTAGQALLMNSSANAPEWGAAGGANTPMFYVSKSGNQSTAGNTETTITFDVEEIDTDNAFASNTFTVPSGKGGKYFLFAQVRTDTGDDFEACLFGFKVNGTKVCSSWWRNFYYNFGNISHMRNLSAGDTVTVWYKQDSGGTKNVGAQDSGDVTFFGGYRLVE